MRRTIYLILGASLLACPASGLAAPDAQQPLPDPPSGAPATPPQSPPPLPGEDPATPPPPPPPPPAAPVERTAPPPSPPPTKAVDLPESHPAPPAKGFLASLEFGGSVDFYAAYNLVEPDSHLTRLRAFDTASGPGLHLNYAELTLAYAPAPFGFRLDVGFGDAVDVIGATDPARMTDPQLSAWHRNFEQAYVSLKLPVAAKRSLTFDVGKFVTPHGLEVIETRDNWSYSRSLLFAFAIPFFHTGLRVTLSLGDTLLISGYWVNGWNAFVLQGSNMRTGGLQISWTPSEKVQLIVNYMGGYSGGAVIRPMGDSVRHLVDVVGVFKPTARVSLAVNGDFGFDHEGTGNLWWVVAAYVRYQVLSFLACIVRGEHYDDHDGFTTGTAQKLWEVTVTPVELTVGLGKASLLFRVEYRRDQSDLAVFEGKPGPIRHQDTITVGTVGYF